MSPAGYKRQRRGGLAARRPAGRLIALGCLVPGCLVPGCLVLGCLVLGCLVLAGCSASSAGSTGSGGATASAGVTAPAGVSASIAAGPLGEGGSQGTLCSPVAKGQVLSDGFDPLMNSGQAPVTIEAVSLADPHHLVLLTAYVVPISGGFLYGVHSGFPPAPNLDPGVLWSKRQLAVGASIPHSSSGHLANLLLVVKPTASTGSAAGVLIAYRVAGQVYQFQSQVKLIVKAGRQCPSV